MTAVLEVAVVVPVHDEQELLPACLEALCLAAEHVAPVPVRVVVVLDSCTDGSAAMCERYAVEVVETRVLNAGRARGLGFEHALRSRSSQELWLGSTDADSRVKPDWLALQLEAAALGADAVFGVVDVEDWGSHSPTTIRRFQDLYVGTSAHDTEPHPHRHGTCFGIRASTYQRIGGMPPLAVGEDQALAELLAQDVTATVRATTSVRVVTSSRPRSRVAGGFASLLAGLA